MSLRIHVIARDELITRDYLAVENFCARYGHVTMTVGNASAMID